MRRLVPILALLLLLPLRAFGQIVSPGGGNVNGAIIGGSCTAPEFMQGITVTGTPECAITPGGAGVPPGNPPQVVGYSAANVGAAITIGGDMTLAASGANAYTATVARLNGVIPGGACTGDEFVNAINQNGTPSCSLPTGSGPSLPIPVEIVNGGTGTETPPTVAQILVAASTTAYAPVTVSGDATIAVTGAITVTSVNGQAGPYIPQNNGTYTGLLTGPNLNLTGALTFNGNAVGGNCTPSQYMTSLSASLVPGCSAIAGGNGIIFNNGTISIVSPVTVANGGLGFSAITPTAGMLPIALNANNYIPRAITGDATLTSQGVLTVTQLNGGVPGGACPAGEFVEALNNQAIPTCAVPPVPPVVPTPYGVTIGGTGTSTAPTVGEILIASSTLAYQPRTMSGDATISTNGAITVTSVNGVPGPFLTGAAGSITDVMLANAYSGVGACAAGLFVTALNRNAAPTCEPAGVIVSATAPATPVDSQLWFSSTDLQTYIRYNDGNSTQWVPVVNIAAAGAGSFAPLVNPATGQNNYLPINVPVFTNTMQGTAGGNQFFGLSTAANQAAPWASVLNLVMTTANQTTPPAANMISITANGNWTTDIGLSNSVAGASASESIYLNNDAGQYAAMQLTNTGFNLGGIATPANTYAILTDAANGIAINSGAAPTNFWVNNANVGRFIAQGLVLPNTASASVLWGSATAPTGSLLAFGNLANLDISAGIHYDGTNWIADATAASAIILSGNGTDFWANTGLTVGNTVTPTIRFNVSTTGVLVKAGGHLGTMLEGAPSPSVSQCGTPEGSMGVNSTDTAGFVIFGPNAGGCQVTYGTPYINSVVCVATAINADMTVSIQNPALTGFTIVCGTGAAGQCTGPQAYYICLGIDGT